MHVRVADSTELDIERDIVVPSDVPLDLYLLEGSVRGGLGPGNGGVHPDCL